MGNPKQQALLGALDKLSPKDQDFARSLCYSPTPSEKQLYWIDQLLERTQPKIQHNVTTESGVSGIHEFLLRNNKAKYPKVRILWGEKTLLVSKATEKARFPGSLNVVTRREGLWGGQENVFLGRIHLDGRFEPHRQSMAEGSENELADVLANFANDPLSAVKAYGFRTGHCCLCGLKLDDERSVLMGYGPVCAKKYQLPWGSKPSKEK